MIGSSIDKGCVEVARCRSAVQHPLPERHCLGGRGRKRGFFVVDRVWRRVEEEHKGKEGLQGSIVECETGLAALEQLMWPISKLVRLPMMRNPDNGEGVRLRLWPSVKFLEGVFVVGSQAFEHRKGILSLL